jgi:hypothetical protein
MTIQEIKSSFHSLIEECNDLKLLESFYEILKDVQEKDSGKDFWDELTDEQKKEIELAIVECEIESNLEKHDVVMDRARKWPKK